MLAAALALTASSTLSGAPPPQPQAPHAPPSGYYDSVNTSTAALLRSTLNDVIDDHTYFPYNSPVTGTWDILELADEDPNNSSNILDLYKNASYVKVGAGNPNYQREHTWPNSYGFPVQSSVPYTDCHALFLADGSYNGSRSRLPYQFCEGCTEKVTVENNGYGGGSGTYPGYSNWRTGSIGNGKWETWIKRRGDVARALFYMDVRYEGGTHVPTGKVEPDLILTDSLSLLVADTENMQDEGYMGALSVLLRWHLEDLPDKLERDHHEVVFGYQGNRNPFIDHPEWVSKVFGHLRIFVADLPPELVRQSDRMLPVVLGLVRHGPGLDNSTSLAKMIDRALRGLPVRDAMGTPPRRDGVLCFGAAAVAIKRPPGAADPTMGWVRTSGQLTTYSECRPT